MCASVCAGDLVKVMTLYYWKVFEVAGSTVKDTCVISTILPVSRVHWRPSYRSQVARYPIP